MIFSGIFKPSCPEKSIVCFLAPWKNSHGLRTLKTKLLGHYVIKNYDKKNIFDRGKAPLFEGTNFFDIALKARPWEIVESLSLGYPTVSNSYPQIGKMTVYPLIPTGYQ